MITAQATSDIRADIPTDADTVHRLRRGSELPRRAEAVRRPREVELDRSRLIANGIFGLEDLDMRARSFVMLRSQLLNRFYRQGGRVLAVTSSQPGNGKTYITANVATALSRIHPTVLIDLDLRRPSLAARFGVSPAPGTDDYLTGDAGWNDTALRIAGVDLTIHGVREPRQNSATLLSSERLGRMFDTVRNLPGAPICIVDTPPTLLLDDILLIARNVDGVLMVVEEGSTRGADIVDALRLLSPTPIVGSVLNKSLTSERIKSGYGYYDDAV